MTSWGRLSSESLPQAIQGPMRPSADPVLVSRPWPWVAFHLGDHRLETQTRSSRTMDGRDCLLPLSHGIRAEHRERLGMTQLQIFAGGLGLVTIAGTWKVAAFVTEQRLRDGMDKLLSRLAQESAEFAARANATGFRDGHKLGFAEGQRSMREQIQSSFRLGYTIAKFPWMLLKGVMPEPQHDLGPARLNAKQPIQFPKGD